MDGVMTLERAAPPPPLSLAERELERLQVIAEDAENSAALTVGAWRTLRGRHRTSMRRRAASALQAVRMARGAVAQAARAVALARRAAGRQQ